MNETGQPISVSEVFERMRVSDLPDFRTWSGSEAERARNAEAEEYIASVGINSLGKRYIPDEILGVKRREIVCSECGGEAGNIAGCAAHGYKALLYQCGVWIRTISVPCGARAAVERQEAVERLICALPAKLKKKSFENFRADDVSESVREALSKTIKAAETGESLILAGNVGAGKTHLAAALLVRAIHSGKQGLYSSVPSLMNRLRSFGPRGDYQDVLDAAIGCDVLLLDDLGAERCTDWVGEQLYMLVNERYISNRQTVVTTNFSTPGELITHLEPDGGHVNPYATVNCVGQRIVSRLCEMGAWVTLTGADRRIRRMPKTGQAVA
jgi:DNA replication protein DnaC